MLAVYIIIGCIIYFIAGNLVIGFMQASSSDYWITVDSIVMVAVIVFWPLYLIYKLMECLAAVTQDLGFHLYNKFKKR